MQGCIPDDVVSQSKKNVTGTTPDDVSHQLLTSTTAVPYCIVANKPSPFPTLPTTVFASACSPFAAPARGGSASLLPDLRYQWPSVIKAPARLHTEIQALYQPGTAYRCLETLGHLKHCRRPH